MTLAVAAALLCGEVWAARTLEPIEGAHEVRLTDIVLPPGPVGSLIVRPCPECDPVSLLVDGNTTYSLAGQPPIALADFTVIAQQLLALESEETSSSVGVFYLPGSMRATRIVLYPAR
ncbi:MAG TPA: hypothetical protein VIN61_09150 [Gammaproteobacteria bacterium]